MRPPSIARCYSDCNRTFILESSSLPGLRCLSGLILLAFPLLVYGASHTRVDAAPVPQDMRSSAFTMTVNGAPIEIAHAAASLEYANFDFSGGPIDVSITAAEPGFWDRGVDIEPWRLGIRPIRDGQTIRFKIDRPQKLSISRPRDFLNHASMLFVFAGEPPASPPNSTNPSFHFYPPGVYHQSLNPKSGDTYYLAPGSYFYGSLNLWKVSNVKVQGRGTIIYEGT